MATQEISAQYRIQLLNGKLISAQTCQENNMYVSFRKPGDKGTHFRSIDRYDVFSITDSMGIEKIIYRPTDTLDLTVEEARFFIDGENAARQFYTPLLPPVSAALVGVGSSLLGLYGLPLPMLYAVVLTRAKAPEMSRPPGYDQALVNNEAFRLGYEKAARNIKIQRCLTFGYIGLGAGIAGLLLLR